MTGGLLQIVTSGKQDIYLTINPEITFFKKVYRRYTNFALELREIPSEQPSEFNSITSFILNNGDALHRCYLEIELPNYVFSDKFITSSEYKTKKSTDIANINQRISLWQDYYNNLKGYVDVEIKLYRNLYNYLQTENISINTLKDEVSKFNILNKTEKDFYKNKVEQSVFLLIDISGYINSITKLITNNATYNTTYYISRNDILIQINLMYASMIEYLNFYNNKVSFYSKQLTEKSKDTQINFNFAEHLGHNFFDYFNVEMGGIEIEKYSNDILHINQMHAIKQESMDNYLEMIGHTPDLLTFDNNIKGNKKLIVPLIFWFNKDAGSSLPLVSMQYTSVIINAKITDIKNIICFQNFGNMFDQIVKVSVETSTNFTRNKKLIYTDYSIDTKSKMINYDCLYINDELLQIQFQDLTLTERNILLTNNGTLYSLAGLPAQYVINRNQWISFMVGITKPIYATLAPKVGSYYPYINYNQYYSLINNPIIKLIGEFVYLDDVERGKFADSKLEYLIETFDENLFNITNPNFFDCEISFNKPCKELLWYFQPEFYKDKLLENGQNYRLLFDLSVFFVNSIMTKQNLTFNQMDVLLNGSNNDFNFYTNLLSYKYLNNILPEGIYYKSFSLYPEETQPSGTANLNKIKGKQYKVEFNKLFIDEYKAFLNQMYLNTPLVNKNSLYLKFIAKSYNLFIVSNGQARLMFN